MNGVNASFWLVIAGLLIMERFGAWWGVAVIVLDCVLMYLEGLYLAWKEDSESFNTTNDWILKIIIGLIILLIYSASVEIRREKALIQQYQKESVSSVQLRRSYQLSHNN